MEANRTVPLTLSDAAPKGRGGVEGSSSADLRRDRRFPITLAAELWLAGRTYRGRIRNLSMGGAYVELIDDAEVPEDAADAWLFAPTLGPSAEAEVRYRRTVNGAIATGLRFREPNQGVRNRVRELLEAS